MIGVFRYPACLEHKEVFRSGICKNITNTFNEIGDSNFSEYNDCSCKGRQWHQSFTGT